MNTRRYRGWSEVITGKQKEPVKIKPVTIVGNFQYT